MKRSIKKMSALLTMMAVAILTFTFTACSDDDDPVTEVTYTYGFSSMSASHPDFLEEMGKIENASSRLSVSPGRTLRNGVRWKSVTSRFTKLARKPAIRSKAKCGRATTFSR